MNDTAMKLFNAIIIGLTISFSTTTQADLEHAKQLMEADQFTKAYQTLLPFAQAGNAEAEELIGVMYAMGLGVEKDDIRAFEWYLRSAMKGHPGAQSGIGWYYEVGRGITEVDLVRAYLWYGLSAIGGDPDAAVSIEEVVKKMTPNQISKARELIEDYRGHLYPFKD
ncbi:tetratricopeptide repeat protein [Reinekea marina]|nr:tetratricopeptide repeat protein [Reinekea marina]MDN3647604.1 tetratricopeptide repeat protein [Reinekea marina]